MEASPHVVQEAEQLVTVHQESHRRLGLEGGAKLEGGARLEVGVGLEGEAIPGRAKWVVDDGVPRLQSELAAPHAAKAVDARLSHELHQL